MLIVGVRRVQELGPPLHHLGIDRLSRVIKRRVKRKDGRFVRIQRRLVAANLHRGADITGIAKITLVPVPYRSRYAKPVQETPVAQGDIRHQERRVFELFVGHPVRAGQVPNHMTIDPAASRHHHGLCPDTVILPVARVNQLHMIGCFGIALMLHAKHGRVQAHPHGLPGKVEGMEVDFPGDYILKMIRPFNSVWNELLEEVPDKARIPARE